MEIGEMMTGQVQGQKEKHTHKALSLELTNSYKILQCWHVFPYLNANFVNKYTEMLLRLNFKILCVLNHLWLYFMHLRLKIICCIRLKDFIQSFKHHSSPLQQQQVTRDVGGYQLRFNSTFANLRFQKTLKLEMEAGVYPLVVLIKKLYWKTIKIHSDLFTRQLSD